MPTAIELQLRRFILVLLSFGLTGLFLELIALEHYEDAKQWIPLVSISLTLLAILWHAIAPTRVSVTMIRMLMVILVVVGGLGIVLHFRGNVEFQLEVSPELAGWALIQKVLNAKAPPALAPGVMAQLGLLGLIYTFRHPVWRESAD